jgi:hypothetical protein
MEERSWLRSHPRSSVCASLRAVERRTSGRIEHQFVLILDHGVTMPTSAREATKAAKVLADPKSTKLDKSLAGATLAERKGAKKPQ